MTTQNPSSRGAGPSYPPPTRRGFLTGVATSAGLTAAGVAATSAPARAAAGASVTWSLAAVPTTYDFVGGTTLPYFRLQPVGAGETRGLLPFFEATEGEVLEIAIDNQLPVAIQPAVFGVQDGPLIPAGASASFSFAMPRAGTYLVGPARPPWATGTHAPTFAPGISGLAATLVSRPTSGLQQLWNGGPSFEREYVLLFEDADERLNTVMGDPSPPPLPPYEPNFFTLNGLAFPATVSDPDTVVAGQLGERILIRMGNLGRMRQSIHAHGYHAEIAARDNVPETVLPPKDTFPLPANSTVDLILTPGQKGAYPLHPHSLTAVAANGLYPFGQLTLIVIS